MRDLCTLILLIASPAWAVTNKLYSELQYQSLQTKPVLAGATASADVQKTSQMIEYRAEGLAEIINLNVASIVSQPDYSTYKIRGRDGHEQALTEVDPNTPKSEVAVRVGAVASHDTHMLSSRYTQTVTDTPFANRKVELKLEESLLEKTTTFGAEFSMGQRQQPQSYFINRDLVTRSRPREINATQYGLFYEQVLTNRWKAMLKTDLETQPEERPRNYGVSMRHSYAITKRIFAHAGVGHRFEDHEDSLKNERGYFSLWRYDVGLIFEPIYDFYIKPSYGLMVEKEDEPRAGQVTTIGSDHAGLILAYNFGDFEIEASGQASFSEAGSSSSYSGSLLWNF